MSEVFPIETVFPIEEFSAEVSAKNPCGVFSPVNEAQIAVLDGAVKRVAGNEFLEIRKVAEGLFRGGEIPDLASQKAGATLVIKEPFKHLRAAMVLTLTGLATEGLPGFAAGLILIEKLLSTHWDNLHPVANVEDEEDPFIRRVNILSPLSVDPKETAGKTGPAATSDAWKMEQRLFSVELLVSERHVPLSLRDAISPWAKSLDILLPQGEDREADYVHEVRLGASGMLKEQAEVVQAAINSLAAIDEMFKQAPGTIKPKFEYLLKILRASLSILDDSIGSVPLGKTDESPKSAAPGTNSTSKNSGPVGSRDDAIRKLAEVADYFRRNEPSSPIPLMIDRVKRLVGMNFMGLLQELELGEQAVPEFRKLAGLREQEAQTATEEATESETKTVS